MEGHRQSSYDKKAEAINVLDSLPDTVVKSDPRYLKKIY